MLLLYHSFLCSGVLNHLIIFTFASLWYPEPPSSRDMCPLYFVLELTQKMSLHILTYSNKKIKTERTDTWSKFAEQTDSRSNFAEWAETFYRRKMSEQSQPTEKGCMTRQRQNGWTERDNRQDGSTERDNRQDCIIDRDNWQDGLTDRDNRQDGLTERDNRQDGLNDRDNRQNGLTDRDNRQNGLTERDKRQDG